MFQMSDATLTAKVVYMSRDHVHVIRHPHAPPSLYYATLAAIKEASDIWNAALWEMRFGSLFCTFEHLSEREKEIAFFP